MNIKNGVKAVAIAAVATAFSAWGGDNALLKGMYEADQRDRGPEGPEEARCLMNVCDRERQAKALELLKAGEVRTANDHFHAAIIFQHSMSTEDIGLAYALATIAARMDPDHVAARWLTAAAWDRALIRRKQAQWYGTQFTRKDGKWVLYPVDESVVTDEERVKLGVPTLAESRERVRKMNQEDGAQAPP